MLALHRKVSNQTGQTNHLATDRKATIMLDTIGPVPRLRGEPYKVYACPVCGGGIEVPAREALRLNANCEGCLGQGVVKVKHTMANTPRIR